MFRHGLKAKILYLTIGLSFAGLGLLVFTVIKEEERNLLDERMKASELMAQPILHSIYKDMLEERADIARFLITGLKTIKGVEKVQIIRSNGVEEAFEDYKTLRAVKAEFGEIKPEWLLDHPNKLNNVAHGIENPEFKKAIMLFKAGRKDAVHYTEKNAEKSLFVYLVPIESRPKCGGCHAREDTARGILMISTSLDEMYGLLKGSRNKWILHGVITIAAMTLILGFLIGAIITRPIDKTVHMLKDIADGTGDLTRRLTSTSGDEIGMLGRSFNRFAEGLRNIVKDVFSITGSVSTATKEIERSSEEIIVGVGRQLKAVEETSSHIKEMDASIKIVAEEAEALKASSSEVSSSAETMSSAVDEVKANIEKLFYSISSITSSINEIAISINQVASHIDELFRKTEDIVSSIFDIGQRITEVENYSREQAELSEKVRFDAEDMGLSSVAKTREGIEKVSIEVAETAEVINRLGERSSEIGKVLTVINDIADTTHLLALNATIHSSQAGEHGKGFAVVARQIKDLATKTTASTKEISELINHVQNEASTAVEAMRRSSSTVEDGVMLSRDAEEALRKILDSARRSFEMAKMIEKATVDKTRGVGQISNAAEMISSMVADIKTAADEQSAASKEILKDTVLMKELMEKVRLSTIEQTRETKKVFEAILKVAGKITTVAGATTDQMMLSRRMVEAVGTVRKAAVDNAELAAKLEKTVKEMNKQADKLRSTVENFKT